MWSQQPPLGEIRDDLLGGGPSSSILIWPPLGGGGASAITVVRDPASPTRSGSTPMSASESVSLGFDFAPMIPFSDG